MLDEIIVSDIPRQMTPGQLVTLLDAAMLSRDPVSYLQGIVSRFEMMEHLADAATARKIMNLIVEGEIQQLLVWRTEWQRADR